MSLETLPWKGVGILAISRLRKELGEFQILTNREFDTITLKITLEWIIWASLMLLYIYVDQRSSYRPLDMVQNLYLRLSILDSVPPKPYKLPKNFCSFMTIVKPSYLPTGKSLCLPIFMNTSEIVKKDKFLWMNDWMCIYIPHISHGGLQFLLWARLHVSLWRRPSSAISSFDLTHPTHAWNVGCTTTPGTTCPTLFR